jgi:pimeloyl-ACP methyl ester carboxylesterase
VIADLPGVRLWYEDTGGEAVPIVLAHAGTGSASMWIHQAAAFARGYRVLAYDRRGHGRTAGRTADQGQAKAAEDLHRLMDHLSIDRFHLAGTAAGGIVALDYALSFPRRLRSLVIANSIGGVQDEDYLELQRRLRPKPQFDALPSEVRELGPAYRAANPEGVRRWKELEHASRPDGVASLPSTVNRITFSLLETLQVPTLLITGDADLYTPPPVLQLFQDRIKNSQSLVLPQCGHSAYWEQPELFNRAVLDFIGNH